MYNYYITYRTLKYVKEYVSDKTNNTQKQILICRFLDQMIYNNLLRQYQVKIDKDDIDIKILISTDGVINITNEYIDNIDYYINKYEENNDNLLRTITNKLVEHKVFNYEHTPIFYIINSFYLKYIKRYERKTDHFIIVDYFDNVRVLNFKNVKRKYALNSILNDR